MPNHTKQMILAEEKISQECRDEILLLLNHLASSQPATVKLILDRLYDIGVSNIAQKKLRSCWLRGIFRLVSRLSKPAFRQIGYYWFEKNCPKLITDWLVEQVAFDPPEIKLVTATSQVYLKEVKQLRSQVRLLTAVVILISTVLGGGLVWLNQTHYFKPEELTVKQPDNSHF